MYLKLLLIYSLELNCVSMVRKRRVMKQYFGSSMMKIKKSMTSHDNVGLTVDYRNFVVIFIPDQCQKHALFFFRNFHVANYIKFENSIAGHSSIKLLAKVTGGDKFSYHPFLYIPIKFEVARSLDSLAQRDFYFIFK